ncbi:Diaminopimelate decarboxylase [bioreactor metagenome]|jgi:diaminopimelate decarboxylase|uniref:Diaminopimelate decarboxylase n=1 Tax=bioreactor metagenome TaxID=1076179 RepID=A0A644VDA9_9ZZZZ|nr:alanine racemase [Paludibacter sp.]
MEKKRYERPTLRKMNTGLMNKFGTKTENEPVTHIESVSVKGLLKEYGSPLFVISERQIRRNFQNASRIFKTRYPKVQFAWSYKTNYLDAVCQIFHQEGSWAEVVSGFEYNKALKNGVPGNKIIFNGPDKSDEQLVTAAKKNSLIHIDHYDELYALIRLSEEHKLRPRVAIRINMDTGIYPKWDRFGFNFENGQAWNALTRIINSPNLELVGLHCHIGTFMLSPAAYATAARNLCELAWSVKERYGKILQYIDLGGGFPSTNTLKGAYLPGTDTVPTLDQFADAITDVILGYGFSQEELPLLILESGRALIDDAGYLLGTVLATKRLSDGRRATILDFGLNSLFTSLWYEHKVSPAQPMGQQTEEMILYGPLCMNIDIVRESIVMPLLEKGNQLVVHQVGAYNMTQWMQFITLRPNIVLIDTENNTHIIRKAETMEYIDSLESVPNHLK